MTSDQDQLINEAVEKALAGDLDAVNKIEDRILRSKAKAALVKAKRAAQKPEVAERGEKPQAEEKQVQELSPIAALVSAEFPDSVVEIRENGKFIELKPEQWHEIAAFLHDHPDTLMDQLECLTGIDLGVEEPLQVRYNLHSMQYRHKVEIWITTARANPRIPSVETVWRMADWFERETYDMYGIEFEGHHDLRRILCPEDWEGWPLRKDYETQETYHGIVVPKVKEGWE